MLLSMMTWPEVDEQLSNGICALLPVGSIEQHGPMGLIGTDAICATAVAQKAAEDVGAIVAPTIEYAPAPFNTAFAGTVSITPDLFGALVTQVCQGLLDQGFLGVFIVNGHGANLEPIAQATASLPKSTVAIQSWWAPALVNGMRADLYGDWEGMHATPSEVAITQALHGARAAGVAAEPPKKLTTDYIRAHSGDRHGPPDQHRADFPDGRVGSHSALATPEHGAMLLEAAAQAIGEEFVAFQQACRALKD
ncbi:creatininase [Sulfitobacter sp. SK012]|uniref:creatininase family protein n=1 Tax=Sulfitobacter sp. SK012 TaxID=1389005 RepID=UPI000E0A6D73|nr:creatininase family protein [Sulfitobacter sp. SK012]AXI48844.1 creatininase [Sulfitobacter sp. SK012]